MPKRLNLKNILTFNFIIVAALPVLVVGFITLKILTHNLTQEITEKNFLLAKTLAGEIERFLDEPFAILEQIEEIVEKRRMVPQERINEYLETIIRQYGFFNMIQILDQRGEVRYVAPFHPDYIGVNLSGQKSYQSMLRYDRPYWSPTFISIQTGEPTLTLTRHYPTGMLIGNLNLAILNSIADKVKIGVRGYAVVTDQNGTVIAHPNRSLIAERVNINNLTVIEKGLAGSEGTFRYFSEGIEKLGSVSIVSQTGWPVVVQQPISEAFAPVQRIKNLFFAGAAVAMALALGLALFSLKKALRPLSQLVSNAQQIAEGRYEFAPQPASYPEIDALAHDLKLMSQAVAAREDALRKSEEGHRAVLEANPDPVVVYDINGNVTFFNHAFTRVFGWTLAERLGKKLDDFVPEEAWPETKVMIDKVLAGENFSGIETRRYDKYGKLVPVSISAAIYKDQNGNPIGSVINLRNISEQKKLQVLLDRAQKMEAIGALAGGVAHDLNNILSGLVSYPELLLLDLPENDPLRKPLVKIQESGQKAAMIVQDLLTLARRGVAVTEVINLNTVISGLSVSPEYEKLQTYHPGIAFEFDLAPDLLNILGSPVHLSKSIMNLISNAAEAIQTAGNVWIKTENKYIDRPIRGYEAVKEGDYVLLQVVDNGIGMTPEDLTRIFEPFYTKKVMGRSGTGLGMAVVWGTVKDHNGYIDVQSTPGQGTRCELFFPVTRQLPPKERATTMLEELQGTETILVVDDVKEQREIAYQLLTRLGYHVDTVASGEDAIGHLQKNAVDLIVLDMIMDPGLDGLETYREILRFHPGQKAIIASGFSETERVREAQRLGAGAYIKKPYLLETLGRSVRKELDR
jgi:PAS domain S-box-containing protein